MGALFAQSAVLTPCTGGLSAICVWVKAEIWYSLPALLSSSVDSPVGLLQKELKRGANRGAFSTHYPFFFTPEFTPRLGFCRRGSTGLPTGEQKYASRRSLRIIGLSGLASGTA